MATPKKSTPKSKPAPKSSSTEAMKKKKGGSSGKKC